MKIPTFLFLSFIVGAVADIILHDLSRWGVYGFSFSPSKAIQSLEVYFNQRPIMVSALYAGLTILFATILLFGILFLLCGEVDLSFSFSKESLLKLGFILVLSYSLGYILDILIDTFSIFGNSLKPFYKIAGSGHWGALSFLFALVISYTLQKFLLPLL